jgi:hypothetical protein
VRHPLFSLLRLTAFFILSCILVILGRSYVYAGSEAIEDQVARILIEESAGGRIKVVILDFSVSSADPERKLSEKELKDRGAQYNEEFTANLINKLKDAGKRDKISIIDSSRLDDILREKNLPITGAPERSSTEIGRLAGLDVIISGRIKIAGNSVTAMAKVVRVKDGEILTIAKQDRQEKQEKQAAIAHTTVTLLDTLEKLKIGSYKALPLSLTSDGTLKVAIDVVRGNSMDINVIPGSELKNFEDQKEFKDVADFAATKMKKYKRSANLNKGDYYIVIRDSSLGIFSVQNSEVKITVQVEQ